MSYGARRVMEREVLGRLGPVGHFWACRTDPTQPSPTLWGLKIARIDDRGCDLHFQQPSTSMRVRKSLLVHFRDRRWLGPYGYAVPTIGYPRSRRATLPSQSP